MRALRTLTLLAGSVALTGALVGCGSDTGSDEKAGEDTSASDGTSAGDDETDSSSGGLVDICTEVTDAEIATILGGPVTREDVPGGGCTFNQDDPRAPSLSLATSAFDEGNGGFDGAVSGVSGVIQGDAGGPVSGIGDEAYVKTGTTGGDNQQAGGVVHVGGTLVQATLIQGNGLPAEKVKGFVVDALTLVAGKV